MWNCYQQSPSKHAYHPQSDQEKEFEHVKYHINKQAKTFMGLTWLSSLSREMISL